MARVIRILHVLVRAWEELQVELQGQYSPTRLDELQAFTRQTGVMRATAILLLTPIICTVMAVVFDVMPLCPPTGGIHQQSITYWLRVYFILAIGMACVILQFQHASSQLPIKRWPFIAAVTLISAAAPLLFLAVHVFIGFPTPFVIQLVTPAVYPFHFIAMWSMWKTFILGDSEVQRDLRQFILMSMCLFAMLSLYPVMVFVFGKLDGIQQTLFSLAFPVLKLLFKNWASRGLFRLEDRAPVYVVTSIDVFHTLLLSCAMKSAASSATLVSIVGIDVFQSFIAFVEVRAVIKRLGHLRLEVPMPNPPLSLLSQTHHHNKNILSVACSFLESHPHIRNIPAVGLPRHRRQVPSLVFASMAALWSPTRITPVARADPSRDADGPQSRSRREMMGRCAAEADYVRFTLKLLHMVEFYVLIEFIEVVVATIYAIYLTAMFYLPNRAYYPAVRTLSHDQLVETVGQVLQYAALELLSLAVLCVVLDRLLGFSTLRLLAFTLRKHAVLVQSQLTLWVFLSTQLSLEHLGCDYTLRFAWLRRHPVEQNGRSGASSSAT